MSRSNRSIWMLVIAASVSTAVIGVGCGPDGAGPNLGSLTGSLTGTGSGDTQRVLEGAKLGAKAVDVLDMENPARQQEIGQSVAVAISNRYTLSTNQPLNDYVNLVGLTVGSVSPNPDINYAFGVIESPEVNAYSTPGGYIFVTTGSLALMSDESELAGVLAHEVAHVALNHGIDAVKNAKRTDLAISAAKTADQQLNAYGRAVDVATDAILIKGYSRGQESQADAQAVKYLIAAGYDPNGLVRFLQRMQSQSGTGGGTKQLMSTHPGTAERIASVQKQIASTGAGGVTLRERFVLQTARQ